MLLYAVYGLIRIITAVILLGVFFVALINVRRGSRYRLVVKLICYFLLFNMSLFVFTMMFYLINYKDKLNLAILVVVSLCQGVMDLTFCVSHLELGLLYRTCHSEC